jgi:ribosomal protein S18 acetylase RimI-like enzyme
MLEVRHIEIKEGDIETVVALSQQIPEFVHPHGVAEYHKRLTGVPHLILITSIDNQSVGFKVGYEREGNFYSWMGGILPDFRRLGVAQALADAQEHWAKEQGYPHITFKTRNSHKGMLVFALKNGFDIIGFEERTPIGEARILLRKKLQ